MKLIYRGTTYGYNPEAQESSKERETKEAYELSYRGRQYWIDPQSPSEDASGFYPLRYRGITYLVNRPENGVMSITSYSGEIPEQMSLALA
jgi:hypothetical protein